MGHTLALDRLSDKGYVRPSMTRPYPSNGCCTARAGRDRRIADGCAPAPLFGARPETTDCGFYPRRFRRKAEVPA